MSVCIQGQCAKLEEHISKYTQRYLLHNCVKTKILVLYAGQRLSQKITDVVLSNYLTVRSQGEKSVSQMHFSLNSQIKNNTISRKVFEMHLKYI